MSVEKTIWPGSTQLAPVPVVLVGTGDGHRLPWNIMTVAWAGTVASDPPMVAIGVRESRFTYHQISGRDTDKFSKRGLTPAMASKITAPIVEECPLALECEVRHRLDLGSHIAYIGEVVAVQVTSSLVDKGGHMDIEKANLLAYAHGHYFSLGKELGRFGFSVRKR